jgi:hypothetical protein
MVLAWFNPEMPVALTVTDMNRENAFCIVRSPDVPAMDAPETAPELYEAENERIAAHQSYATTRYRMLRTKHATPFRRAMVDRATAELGEQIAAGQSRLQTEHGQEEKREAKASKVYSRLRMVAPENAARRPGMIEAAEQLDKLLKEEETT